MQVCEVCGRECDINYKFCPECGFGFADRKSKDKSHHLRRDMLAIAAFPATITTLAIMRPGDKWWYAPIIIFFLTLFYLIGPAVAEVFGRKTRNQWLLMGQVVLAAAIVAAFLNVALGNDFFPIVGYWLD